MLPSGGRTITRHQLKMAVTKMSILKNECEKIFARLNRVLEDIDELPLPTVHATAILPSVTAPKNPCPADFQRVIIIAGPHKGHRGVAHSVPGTSKKLKVFVYALSRDELRHSVFPVLFDTLMVNEADVFVLFAHLMPSLADEVEEQHVIVDNRLKMAHNVPNLSDRIIHLATGSRYTLLHPLQHGKPVTCLQVSVRHSGQTASELAVHPRQVRFDSDEVFPLHAFFIRAVSKELEENTLLASSGRNWPNHHTAPPNRRSKPAQRGVLGRKHK